MTRIFTLLLLLPLFSIAQVTNSGKPLSWKISVNTNKYILPAFDLKAIQEEDRINDEKGQGPWRFGHDHLVDINIENSGTWTNLSDGSRIWLYNISSPGALTMNFIFDEFYIPEGGKLYFYNKDKTDLLGAYTHTQNREDQLFGSWLIDGDDIYIEYFEPADKIGQGKLNISKAIHGYRSVTDNFQNKGLNDSGPCNLDVDCSIGSDFDSKKDDLKKSVGLVIVGGTSGCSGALINNTNNDGTPYFLTADHCLFGSVGSWAFRFNWRSPNPVCATGAGSTNGSFDQTVSGATLRATNSGSDFTLVEITAPVPSSWDLVWAGWDRTTNVPSYTVGIHHPAGDIMKVCRDNDSPTMSVQSGAQVWFLNEWEIGVTEPGSSGSPLFNQDGRIIGQLYGGTAACSGTSNNGQPDWYGRFDVSWNSGSSPSTRLREWLDPNNTGQTTLDQFPPAQLFNNDAKISIANLPSEACDELIQPSISIENNGLDPITSATLTYQFNAEPQVTINWTGNILNGESAVITTPNLNLFEGFNVLSASLSLPNGTADQFAGNNSISRTIERTTSYDTAQISLELLTDDYGNETTWTFEDENGNILYQGGPYANNLNITQNFSVNDNTCYVFTINDSVGDGICCGFGVGNYELKTDSGQIIIQGGDFGTSESTNIGVNTNLSAQNFESENINIYQIPTSGVLMIDTAVENISVEILDLTGKKVLTSTKKQLDLSALANGIYFARIHSNSFKYILTKRIIKH